MTERRNKRRFPIQLDVLYRVFDRRTQLAVGVGKTVDISSSGVVFRAEVDLIIGARVEVSTSWPALLNGQYQMRWVVYGNIVRSGGGLTACTIERCEFRTQGRTLPVSASSIRTDPFTRFAIQSQRATQFMTV